jgi:hypothetical protein
MVSHDLYQRLAGIEFWESSLAADRAGWNTDDRRFVVDSTGNNGAGTDRCTLADMKPLQDGRI